MPKQPMPEPQASRQIRHRYRRCLAEAACTGMHRVSPFSAADTSHMKQNLLERPTVDRKFFAATAESLSRIGIALDTLCLRHGIANPLAGDGERIPLSAISPVYDLVALETGDPEFIYRVALATSPKGNLLYPLIGCCETSADSLRLFCRYSGIASDAVSFTLLTRGGGVDVVATPNAHTYVSLHQVEVALFIPLLGFRLLSGNTSEQPIREVCFTHAPRFPVAHYERYFGCPVRFEQPANLARLSGASLKQPLPGANARLADYQKQIIERHEAGLGSDDSLAARVRRLYVSRLAFGEPDAATIAELLNVSTRTLQRRLLDEGTTWRAITEDAQWRVAERELKVPGRLLHEIALLTGFGDCRAFLRAFKRWTGMTPGQYRESQAAPDAAVSQETSG
jgi:AraC-like DNA-binding protein